MAATNSMSAGLAGLWGQLLRFAGVGVLATLTHVCVALLVTSVFAPAPLLANLIGFSVAVVASFWGHLRVTFRVVDPKPQHLYRFIALSLISLAISSLIAAAWTAQGGSMIAAMGIVAVVVPIMSFIAARVWAFAAVEGMSVPKLHEPS